MLWYKGWLETRFKLLVSLGFGALFCLELHAVKAPPGPAIGNPLMAPAILMATSAVMAPIFLAGAGIATQVAFRSRKGLHGSTLFPLSLPVSRFRLLAVRAGLG